MLPPGDTKVDSIYIVPRWKREDRSDFSEVLVGECGKRI